MSFLSRGTPHGRIILGLYDAAFNGQAAVIAFFVISGFCIHWPYASGRRFATIPFLLGRLVRILVPTGAYLLLLRVVPYHNPELTILLWSIWCELVYYALYPVLRVLFVRTSIGAVLAVAYLAASVVAIPILERLGGLTFSIYLMHILGKLIWDGSVTSHGILIWAAEIGFIIGVSSVFYLLVERPSHLLARALGASSQAGNRLLHH